MRPVDPKVPKSLKPRHALTGTPAARAGAPDAFASRLEEAERALERVRGLHEAYFLGMEKRAPEPERLDLQRRLNELRKQGTSNTGLRFRLENLVQRHIVLATYWSRTLREIESGTYRRDIFKATRHQTQRAPRAPNTAVTPKAPADQPPAPLDLAPEPARAPAPTLSSPPTPAAATATPKGPPAPSAQPAAPPRAVPPPIPPAALKRAAAAAIMARPGPTAPAAAPPPPPVKR
jgi:hypothetical protein